MYLENDFVFPEQNIIFAWVVMPFHEKNTL